MAALFRGYLEVTGGAENVDEVLTEVKELLLTSPLDTSGVHDPVKLSTSFEGHDPVALSIDDFEAENNSVYSTSKNKEGKSLNSLIQPATIPREILLSNAEGGKLTDSLECGALDPSVESVGGWEWEQLQQLSQEQLQREVSDWVCTIFTVPMCTQVELNALIKENQLKFEERERIVVSYEDTLCIVVLTLIVLVRMTVKEQRLR